MTGRKKLFLLLRVVGTVAIFVMIFSVVDFSAMVERVSSATVSILVTAFAIACLIPPLTALRWRLVCRTLQQCQPYIVHLEIQLVSAFLGQVLPSYIGGEAVRIWLFAKHTASVEAAAACAVTDRLVGVLALVFLLAVMFPLQAGLVSDVGGGQLLSQSVLSALVLGAVVVLSVSPLGLRLFALQPFASVKAFGDRLRLAFSTPLRLVSSFVVGLTVHIAAVLSIHLLLRATGAEVGILETLVVMPAVFLTMLIPISVAGWGLREGAFVVFLGVVGVSGEISVAVSILFGLIQIVISLPGGFLVLLRGMPKPSTGDPKVRP